MTRLPLIVSGAAFALTLTLTGLAGSADDATGPLARSAPAPVVVAMAAPMPAMGG